MTELIQRVSGRVIEDGGCWNWQGALQSCGAVPTMQWKGKTGAVRRFVLLDKGWAPNKGLVATYTCGNPLCVHPDHLGWASRKTLQVRIVANLKYHLDPMRNKRLADSARGRAKLSLDIAQEVRDADGSQRAVAAKFGISQATVSSIKLGKTWRSYSSPFAGLGAK